MQRSRRVKSVVGLRFIIQYGIEQNSSFDFTHADTCLGSVDVLKH